MKKVSHWWAEVRGRVTLLMVMATLLLILGLMIYRSYQSVGALILGAGLSALIGAVTGSEAIRNESTRQANLERKRTTYGPMYEELKALRVALDNARSGVEPAPYWIVNGAQQPPWIGFQGPTMTKWQEFQRDYRDRDFRQETREALVDVLAQTQMYNGAVNVARPVMVSLVAQAIDEAVATLRNTPEYKRSKQKRDEAVETRQSIPSDWYTYIDDTEARSAKPIRKTVGEIIAQDWFMTWQGVGQPETLGWLIAKRPDKAADYIWRFKYPVSPLRPEQGWIHEVIAAAWTTIESHHPFRLVLDSLSTLEESVKKAETLLDEGLQKIQRLYEGGEPIV